MYIQLDAGKLGYKRPGHCSQIQAMIIRARLITTVITRHLHLYLNFDKHTKLLHGRCCFKRSIYIDTIYTCLFASVLALLPDHSKILLNSWLNLGLASTLISISRQTLLRWNFTILLICFLIPGLKSRKLKLKFTSQKGNTTSWILITFNMVREVCSKL